MKTKNTPSPIRLAIYPFKAILRHFQNIVVKALIRNDKSEEKRLKQQN